MSFLNCACSTSSKLPEDRASYALQAMQTSTSQDKEEQPEPIPQPEYKLHPDEYQICTVIGKGCDDQADICLAKHNPTGSLLAIKRIPLDKCALEISTIQHEVFMMRMMQHHNLLPLLGSFVCDNHLWLLTPLRGYGSCRDVLQAHFNQGLPELAIAYILRDVLAALDYLHTKGFLHRAIRASHILISESGHVSLSGMRHCYSMMSSGKRARTIYDFPEHYIKSMLWASPELLEQNLAGYDAKSDIYSIGITACELANGVVPFSDVCATQMLLEKLDGSMPRLLDRVTCPELEMLDVQQNNAGHLHPLQVENCDSNSRLVVDGDDNDSGQENHYGQDNGNIRSPYQRTFSSYFHQFVETCLQPDPCERPSAAGLLQHSFFKQLRKKATIEALPDLLNPVMPIRDIAGFTVTDSSQDIVSVTQNLEDITMEETEWEF